MSATETLLDELRAYAGPSLDRQRNVDAIEHALGTVWRRGNEFDTRAIRTWDEICAAAAREERMRVVSAGTSLAIAGAAEGVGGIGSA
jgi:hypothetical protein